MNQDNSDFLKHALDLGSVGVVIATLMQWLPNIAALLTVAWLSVRLYNEVLLARSRHAELKRREAMHQRLMHSPAPMAGSDD